MLAHSAHTQVIADSHTTGFHNGYAIVTCVIHSAYTTHHP